MYYIVLILSFALILLVKCRFYLEFFEWKKKSFRRAVKVEWNYNKNKNSEIVTLTCSMFID